jgi:hypothetical protein
MDVAFVIGLALELAGASLLAYELLTVDPAVLASRGVVYPTSPEPRRERQVPAARTIVGFGLLACGFLVQIIGYAIGCAWLVALAAGVLIVGVVAGRLVADKAVAPWLHGRATRWYARRQEGASSRR